MVTGERGDVSGGANFSVPEGKLLAIESIAVGASLLPGRPLCE